MFGGLGFMLHRNTFVIVWVTVHGDHVSPAG